MKLIVTGALGHIGSKLILKLGQEFPNYKIILIDDLSTQRFPSIFNLPTNAKYEFYDQKIQQLPIENLITDAIAVIHLAAITDAASSINNKQLVEENNFSATEIIANACLKLNIPLIFPSTTSVYGSQEDFVDELCQDLKPQSPYAATKLNEEKLLMDLKAQGLNFVICRLGTIFGIANGMRFHTAVNKFCWQATLGQPLSVWETAYEQKRPYLDLTDAINAFIYIINNNLYSKDIINIVTANYTVKQVIEQIKNIIPNLKINFVNNAIMNQLSYEVSNKKFINLGFKFTGSLTAGISDTLNLLQGIRVLE